MNAKPTSLASGASMRSRALQLDTVHDFDAVRGLRVAFLGPRQAVFADLDVPRRIQGDALGDE